MPDSCTSVFSTAQDPSTTTVAALYQCAAVSALVANYTAINCAASFEKICDASYTDNPPFSCTSHERPDFLTTLGECFLCVVCIVGVVMHICVCLQVYYVHVLVDCIH